MEINDLWAKAQQGDERSFRILCDHFFTSLCKYADSFLNDEQLAEETVNDVFFDIWRKRQTIHIFSEADALKKYLRRATRNHCLNALKKKQTQEVRMFVVMPTEETMGLFENYGDDDSFVEKIEMNEIEEEIDKFVEKMPEQRREIFKMWKNEGMTTQEIGERTCLTVSAIRTQLQLTRKKNEKYFEFH